MAKDSDIESAYSDSDEDSDEEANELKDVSSSTATETVLFLLSILTVGISITAMSLGSNYIIYVTGLFSLMGPYGWKIARDLTNVKALQETYEQMVAEVNQLAEENEELKANVRELSDTVEKLNDVEGALDVITQKQGQGVKQFQEQVEKGRELLKGMKKNLRGNVLQSLLSIVMASDEDGDFSIDERETDALIERLHSIQGVTLREDLFREAIKERNGSLQAVMDMVRDIVKNEDIPKEEQIFLIGEE